MGITDPTVHLARMLLNLCPSLIAEEVLVNGVNVHHPSTNEVGQHLFQSYRKRRQGMVLVDN